MEVKQVRALLLGIVAGLTAGSSAWANPDGPTVVHGQVSMSRPNLNTLNITNSPGAVLNWRSFSIGANETTRFIQQSTSSSVLNRVIGENPSQILGQLLSNGRVFLVNPNGVVFGPNSVVDVAGLIASTLQMSDADFMAGRYHFEGDGEGSIDNQGFIRAGPGGEVVLIAPSIENSGIIEAEGGQLILAAGRSVTLASLDYEGVQFEVQAPEDEVLNLGALLAEQGAAGVFAGTIRHSGEIQANSISVDETGAIVLSAQADIHVEEGSTLSASGAAGGEVRVESETGTTWVAGDVDASGDNGWGGTVHVLGERVGLIDQATVEASGETGGGEILIGGDYRGENSSIKNAKAIYIGPEAAITADALTDGDGGRIIVWSEEATRVYGQLSARGGADAGDGGFVETSGHFLDVTTAPAIDAPSGSGGTWLLDPFNLAVVLGPTCNVLGCPAGPNFTANIAGSQVGVGVIAPLLDIGGTTVILDTGGGGAEDGDVSFDASLTKTGAGTSTLQVNADGDVVVGNPITSTGGPLNINLVADRNADLVGSISVTSQIDTGGGTIDLSAPTDAVFSGATITDSTLTASGVGDLSASGSVTTLDGVTLDADLTATLTTLDVQNGLTLGAGGADRTLALESSTLRFRGAAAQTVDGDGVGGLEEIVSNGVGDSAITEFFAGPVTFGPNLRVRTGTQGLSINMGDLINEGEIIAQTAGETLSISGVNALNNNLWRVEAGTWRFTAAGWQNDGTMEVAGGLLDLFSDLTLSAALRGRDARSHRRHD